MLNPFFLPASPLLPPNLVARILRMRIKKYQ